MDKVSLFQQYGDIVSLMIVLIIALIVYKYKKGGIFMDKDENFFVGYDRESHAWIAYFFDEVRGQRLMSTPAKTAKEAILNLKQEIERDSLSSGKP